MQLIDLPLFWMIGIDFAAWFIIHVTASLLTLYLPDRFFLRDNWLYHCYGWEKSGRIWQTRFRVKAWKEYLPDGAAIVGRGFVKKHLSEKNTAFLSQFVIESRRAEMSHWITIFPSVLFFLWNPFLAGCLMIVYAVIVNVPCIIAQRYNRPRLQRILAAKG